MASARYKNSICIREELFDSHIPPEGETLASSHDGECHGHVTLAFTPRNGKRTAEESC